jgi:hypothetical protein
MDKAEQWLRWTHLNVLKVRYYWTAKAEVEWCSRSVDRARKTVWNAGELPA